MPVEEVERRNYLGAYNPIAIKVSESSLLFIKKKFTTLCLHFKVLKIVTPGLNRHN